jgi:LCP family protein required for cell wall assembly
LIPRTRGGALARFALGAAIVIAFTASITAVAGLLEFKQAAKLISATPSIQHARVTIPEPGSPQTILVIGSDQRDPHARSGAHDPPHSDTIILVRLNADSSTINVLSVPRDLRVDIPGRGTAKINESYSDGGPNLLVRTLQQDVFPDLHVNHIVDIHFHGFVDLVNAIGCVYTDVDRRYFNANVGTAATNYSSINLQAGYQKLCGDDALSYVRYRHTDTDIVRSARQQDFIRQAKDQYGQSNLIANRDQLLRLFGRNTQTDPNLHSTDGLINLFNLVAFSAGHAIRETHFPAILLPCDPQGKLPCYVTADPAAEQSAWNSFMTVIEPVPPPAPAKPGGGNGGGGPPTAGTIGDLADGKAQAAALQNPGLPVYVPGQIAVGSRYEGPRPGEYPRAYSIQDQQGHQHAAYRLVLGLNPTIGKFYGVQGIAWQHAPLLAGTSETQVVGGKRLELHYDGHKLRLVAWRTREAVYWVSNTLTLDLTNPQMIGIAASLAPAGR